MIISRCLSSRTHAWSALGRRRCLISLHTWPSATLLSQTGRCSHPNRFPRPALPHRLHLVLFPERIEEQSIMNTYLGRCIARWSSKDRSTRVWLPLTDLNSSLGTTAPCRRGSPRVSRRAYRVIDSSTRRLPPDHRQRRLHQGWRRRVPKPTTACSAACASRCGSRHPTLGIPTMRTLICQCPRAGRGVHLQRDRPQQPPLPSTAAFVAPPSPRCVTRCGRRSRRRARHPNWVASRPAQVNLGWNHTQHHRLFPPRRSQLKRLERVPS